MKELIKLYRYFPKKLAVLMIAVLFVTSMLGYTLYAVNPAINDIWTPIPSLTGQIPIENQHRQINQFGSGFGIKLEIYRNGELVYEKIGDPILDNFVGIFAVSFVDAQSGGITGVSIKNTGGTDLTNSFLLWWGGINEDSDGIEEDKYRYLYIDLLNQTQTITRGKSTYDSGTDTIRTLLTSAIVSYDTANNQYQVELTASFSIQQNFNVSAVAMVMKWTSSVNSNYNEILLIIDNLSSPLNLVNGDSVTVKYVFTLTGGA